MPMPLTPDTMNNMDFHMPDGFYRELPLDEILDVPYREVLKDSFNIVLKSPKRLALTTREFRTVIDAEFYYLGLSLETLNEIRAARAVAKDNLDSDELKKIQEQLAAYLSPLYDRLIEVGFWPYDFTS